MVSSTDRGSATAAPVAPVYEEHCLPGYLGVMALSPDGTVLHVTHSLLARLGWGPDHWIGRDGFALLHPDDLEQAIASLAGVSSRSGYHQPLALRVRNSHGGFREMMVVADNLLDRPDVGAVVLSVTDSAEFSAKEVLAIHQAKVLELIARDKGLDATLGAIAELVESQIGHGRCAVLLAAGRRHFEVGAAPSLFPDELAALETVATDDLEFLAARAYTGSEALVAPDLGSSDLVTMRRVATVLGARSCWSVPIAVTSGAAASGAIDVYHPDAGHPRPEEWSVLKLAARLVALTLEHQARRSQLLHRAEHDAMTGLRNRRAIEDRLGGLVARRGGGAVMVLDIDRLKLVNDSFGHRVGDELIRSVADRLAEFESDGVTVGRMGDDAFVLVLDESAAAGAAELADQVLRRLRLPLHMGHRELSVTSSIGMTEIRGAMSVDAVLRDADLALHDAKSAGRDTVRCCTDALRQRAAQTLQVEAALRATIDTDAIEVHFQPVVDVVTGAPVYMEALARWRTESGWVSPDEFIPVAEESGLIIPLGKQVLVRACRAVKELEDVAPGMTLAVNVSPLQLRSGQMSTTVSAALDAAGLAPERLCVEITEAQMMSPDTSILEELAALRRLGVAIAIDDFGTGYSSLAYLRRLPVDALKVDRAFIEDLNDEGGQAVLELIASVAAQLGLDTVAEGVETREQWDAVRSAGIDMVQGFYVSRPKPLEEVRDVLSALLEVSSASRCDEFDAVPLP
jgi:diguanylate cyclase (GGDEF)-like protein